MNMKEKMKKKYFSHIIILILGGSMITAVFFLMSYVEHLLKSDTEITLMEVVTQNKDTITSKLDLEMNNVSLIATRVADQLTSNAEINADIFNNTYLHLELDESDTGTMFITDVKGNAYFKNGESVNVAGRNYFKLAIDGKPNISDRLVSRYDGMEIFVISVPLVKNGEVIGSVQKFYTPQEMYNLCSLSLFSSKGYMYIINGEGYVLIDSQHSDVNQESNNFFRELYASGNKQQAEKIEDDIKNERAGFMETTIDGEKTFSAYTPINSIHEWYVITSVANDAVSPNGTIIFKMFYVILFVVVIFLISIMLYLLYSRRKQQTRIENIAFIDPVTEGDSYSKFLLLAEEMLLAHPEKVFYLVSFDIDNFKYINKYYGYEFGDKILHNIYQSVHSMLHKYELIARVSSDHFVMLMDDIADKRVDNMMDAMDYEEELTLSLSAGVYEIVDHHESIYMMVDKAGTAAQSMKGNIYNSVELFSEKYDQDMMKREQMKRNIQTALAVGEFIPYYQPKVDIHTNQIIGAEALARWITKEGNMIAPFEFIPICETTGLIIQLDLCIFEKVLAFIRQMLDEKKVCVPISVNLSRLHLLEKNTIKTVTELMKRYRIPPELVEIELTESAFFDNMEVIVDFIGQLHKLGFQVSMDDFGSGYSSLNMLKDVPIDVLKIDRGFIMDTSNIRKQQIIFTAIAQMSKHLNIDVIVEGVETKENIRMMETAGLQYAQGYLYSRPVDKMTFVRICEEGTLWQNDSSL